jgi:hypothetical protein
MAKKPIADEPERVFEEVRYEFTRSELQELGTKLAQADQRRFDLEREKATASSNFGAAIKTAVDTAQELVLKITNRYEMRTVECIVRLDSPRAGQKEYVRTDTGEVARVAAMGPEDRQRSLPLEAEDKRLQ